MRLLLSLAMCAVAGFAAVKNPLAGQPEAVAAGEIHFGESCAACHGANAKGGRGPSLVDNDNVRHMSDEKLFNTIHNGTPSGMPAFALPDQTLWQIVSFVRSLSTPAFFVAVKGDPLAGATVYRKAQCASCHMIFGEGGFLGPDLTDIGSSRTLQQLRDAMVKPEFKPLDGFEAVTVTLQDGAQLSGIAKNYSNYSIDILDAHGKLHLLETAQLQNIDFAKKPLMPDTYGKTLSEPDLQNLLAFLSRQSARPDAQPDQTATNQGEVH